MKGRNTGSLEKPKLPPRNDALHKTKSKPLPPAPILQEKKSNFQETKSENSSRKLTYITHLLYSI